MYLIHKAELSQGRGVGEAERGVFIPQTERNQEWASVSNELFPDCNQSSSVNYPFTRIENSVKCSFNDGT